MKTIHGEPSFRLATPELDLHVTARGGHLAPVVFHLPGRDVSPYALAPWGPGDFPAQPPILSVLRGDFLCLPFGGQVDGPPHGDPANGIWTLQSESADSLCLTIQTSDTGATVEKILSTRAGQHAIFSEHRISNLQGSFNYGSHPVLDLSGLEEQAGRVTVSPFRWASVFPGPFANPAEGETQALAEGARFNDLREVPLATGGTTDLTRYPARRGNEDLVMMVSQPATAEQPFAWSAVLLNGYVWFCLKNPVDFPSTLFWISNGGRTAAPWNSRHLGRIGVEEVCSHFCNGVDLSRQDLLASEGIPTSRHFSWDETASLRLIQAVAEVDPSFGPVSKILPVGETHVLIVGESGSETKVPIDWSFVR